MQNKPWLGERLIFVGGSPRSGTTLTQSMLDSHPDICGGPEFDHVPDVVELRNKLRASVDSGRISVLCSKEDIDREVGLFIEGLLLPYAESRGCKMVSEKTPWNALVFRDLLEIFPEARFILCVRDPRAVVASMLQVNKRARDKGLLSPSATRNVAAAIKTVKAVNGAGFGAARLSRRVLVVVYERLVADPEAETHRICDFLRLPWSEGMLRPGDKRHDGEKVLDGVWHYPEMYDGNPDPERAHRWRDQLTLTQEAMIVDAFGEDEDLWTLGYRFSEGEDVPPTRRAAAKVGFAFLAAENLGFSFLHAVARKVPGLKVVGKSILSATSKS